MTATPVTDRNCQRVRLSEGELVRLIEATQAPSGEGRRFVPLAFGPGWTSLLLVPGTRWALLLVAEMRGLSITDADREAPDLGVLR